MESRGEGRMRREAQRSQAKYREVPSHALLASTTQGALRGSGHCPY